MLIILAIALFFIVCLYYYSNHTKNKQLQLLLQQQHEQQQQHEHEQQLQQLPGKDTYIYLTIANEAGIMGNIIIQLYRELPITSENFRQLCINKQYSNTRFHRVIKGFMIQGGDIDGAGGFSIYGKQFNDEGFLYRHDRPGLLSMANAGPNTNGSQFFITTAPAHHLDGHHVIFGCVVNGMDVVYAVENSPTTPSDVPLSNFYIADCGIFTPTT